MYNIIRTTCVAHLERVGGAYGFDDPIMGLVQQLMLLVHDVLELVVSNAQIGIIAVHLHWGGMHVYRKRGECKSDTSSYRAFFAAILPS